MFEQAKKAAPLAPEKAGTLPKKDVKAPDAAAALAAIAEAKQNAAAAKAAAEAETKARKAKLRKRCGCFDDNW